MNKIRKVFRSYFIDGRVNIPSRPTIEELKSGKTKIRHWGYNSTVKPLSGDAAGVRLFGLLEFSSTLVFILFIAFFIGYLVLKIGYPTVDNDRLIYNAAGVIFGVKLPEMVMGLIYYARYGLAKMQVLTAVPGFIAFPLLAYFFAPVSTIVSTVIFSIMSMLVYAFVAEGAGERAALEGTEGE